MVFLNFDDFESKQLISTRDLFYQRNLYLEVEADCKFNCGIYNLYKSIYLTLKFSKRSRGKKTKFTSDEEVKVGFVMGY